MGKNKSTKIKKMRKSFRHSRKRSKCGGVGGESCTKDINTQCIEQQKWDKTTIDSVMNNLSNMAKLQQDQLGVDCIYTIQDLLLSLQYGWIPEKVLQELIELGLLIIHDKKFVEDLGGQSNVGSDDDEQISDGDIEHFKALNYNIVIKNIETLKNNISHLSTDWKELFTDKSKGWLGKKLDVVRGVSSAVTTAAKGMGLDIKNYTKLLLNLKAKKLDAIPLSEDDDLVQRKRQPSGSLKSFIKNILIPVIDSNLEEQKLQKFIEPYNKDQLLAICNKTLDLIKKINENKEFMCKRQTTIDDGIKVKFLQICKDQQYCKDTCPATTSNSCKDPEDTWKTKNSQIKKIVLLENLIQGKDQKALKQAINSMMIEIPTDDVGKEVYQSLKLKGEARLKVLEDINAAGQESPIGLGYSDYRLRGAGKISNSYNRSKYKKQRPNKRRKYTYKK